MYLMETCVDSVSWVCEQYDLGSTADLELQSATLDVTSDHYLILVTWKNINLRITYVKQMAHQIIENSLCVEKIYGKWVTTQKFSRHHCLFIWRLAWKEEELLLTGTFMHFPVTTCQIMEGFELIESFTVSQLSILWWMSNSVGKGFGTKKKMGSLKRFQQYSPIYVWVSSQVPVVG